MQLLDAAGGPFDLKAQGVTYASMLTKKGIKDIAKYADWLSPNKNWVLPRDPATGATGEPSNVVPLAHQAGLPVVIWTLRAENQFMATNFRVGTDPNAYGDLAAEITAFLDAGVDAFFTDHPDLAVAARDAWVGPDASSRVRRMAGCVFCEIVAGDTPADVVLDEPDFLGVPRPAARCSRGTSCWCRGCTS